MVDGWTFDRCAGHLALDFANTVSSRHLPMPIERLPTFEEVVSFAEQTELTSLSRGKRLRRWAREHRDEAEQLRTRIVALREALFRIFSSVANQTPPAEVDLAILNAQCARVRLNVQFAWEWEAGDDAPDAMLLPIVRSAVELLTSPQRERVSLCAADDCVWLFLDTSKNRSRRWCDMKQCGNRVKARRFYERARS